MPKLDVVAILKHRLREAKASFNRLDELSAYWSGWAVEVRAGEVGFPQRVGRGLPQRNGRDGRSYGY